jgi:hypothetical protein
MPVIRAPTTARALPAVVEPFGLSVEEAGLLLAASLPADLESALSVLHTGVRAVLTGRTWYGCEGETGRVLQLNPAASIPPGITLLTVEGDRRWDRIRPAAQLDHPELFAPAPR